MNTSSTFVPLPRRRRREHSRQFKDEVVAACRQPGISIASVAMANMINANMLRRWICDAAEQARTFDPPVTLLPVMTTTETVATPTLAAVPEFIALRIESDVHAPMPDIRVEIHRGGAIVKVQWPTCAAAQCTVWLREVLR